MGVHGLWDLLAPVGRRVSVETLAGKRLAIDASIWMVQFMKAMRDEKGEMVRNAHLIGFFRRICKLLFLRTKPVFVFDGGTPALKRRTVIARRRQRENAQTKIRKTAEKLLMNHIKTMRLKNLADDLKDQRAKNEKGKAVMSDQSNTLEKNDGVLKGFSQEMIDEMLVASILAEECGGIDGCTSAFKGTIDSKNGDASTSASGAAFLTEDNDENEEDDEEMILPTTNGYVDPAVLAALPPSMQLDLLGQMRERLMAENRQKYQKVKKAPQKFSELQIEAYLKTVAFRREINEVQRAAAGKGVAGVQTSRIASEANREFIFSSSFSGDKQLLVSGGTAKEPEGQQRPEKKDSSLDALNSIASATKSNLEAGETTGEPVEDFGNDVEMFIDENGRKRLSRRRAMGIRMTRDLQRNIELMREHEQETAANNLDDGQNKIDEGNNISSKSHREADSLNAADNFQGDNVPNCIKNTLLEAEIHEDESAQRSQSCINISFNDDEEGKLLDGDDEFFSCLVAGNQVSICSADNSASDCEWEDGVICKESSDKNHDNKLTPQDGKSESDVDWEEGISLINNSEVTCFDVENSQKDENAVELQEEATDIREFVPEYATNSQEVSKGSVEEEDALQEAIKRSLEDLTSRKTSSISPELEKSDYVSKSSLDTESQSPEPSSKLASVLYANKGSLSFVAESDGSNVVSGNGYVPETASSTCTTKESAQIGDIAKNGTNVPTHICGTDSLHVTFVNDTMKRKEVASTCNLKDLSDSGAGRAASILEEKESGTDVKINMAEEDIFLTGLQEQGNGVKIPGSIDEDDIIELVGARLEDELLVLDQEHKNLGDEQRKLERNADSVNAEMFVECQELLQMFGLPYIIAPMEAEAQCAYMELANLVDGVVTDDSDVLLFGSRSVYKNIFDDRKYVETYLMKDIESELGLKREKLIRMAMLLGSDYTEGVSGIGIVNAIEVLTAFPEEDGLRKFREWVESPDPTILGEIGVQSGLSSKRRGSKTSRTDKSNSKSDLEGQGVGSQENEDNQSIDDNERIKQAFMDKHRNVSKNWHIPGSFPSDAVVTAYVAPQVDKSTEPFAWGKPDIFVLRKLCWEKFGWASQKADELLLPVLKEYNKHETQLRLEAFYTFNEKFAKIRSKRIKQAVKGITGKRSLESARTDDLKESPEKKKRRKASTRDNRTTNEEHFTKNNDCVVGDMGSSAKKPKSQRKRRDQNDGSKRGRGRRTTKSVQKDDSNSEVDETSIHIASSSSDERDHELHAEKVPMADSVRRSKRARKDVNYVDKDEGNEEQTDFPNKSEKCGFNEAAEKNLSHSRTVPGDNVELTPLVPSPEDDLAADYILSGGFCANEDEPEIENDELENEEASFDKDYLQMGGGFCVNEEDEEDQNEDQTIDSRIDRSESPLSPESPSDTIQPLSKAQEGSSSGKKDTDISIIADNAEESNAPRFVSAFSAIPYLKRKRKK